MVDLNEIIDMIKELKNDMEKLKRRNNKNE